MNTMNAAARNMVYGNLALARTMSEPEFSVVDGALLVSKSETLRIALEVQVCSCMAYARPQARPASLRSIVFAIVGTLITVACVSVLAFGLTSARTSAKVHAIANLEQESIQVVSGDSLWSIAEAHPVQGMSTSETVRLIRNWNGLTSGTLLPGMDLSVPVA